MSFTIEVPPLVPSDTHNSLPLVPSVATKYAFVPMTVSRTEDPELFFPIGNTGPAIAQIEEAKKVCMRCEVREECLKWAIESGQDAGVWGGLSEDERRAMKRRAARNRARLAEQQNQF